MSVFGVGTQIVECARVAKLIDRHGEVFLLQVFTPREVGYGRERTRTNETFAAVWAAKEAVYRALGSRWRKGMDWRDVEIVFDPGAEPVVKFAGQAKELADGHGVRAVHVALAYTRAFATATAVAERV
ncbi:MAG TPA: holo-ACP synthase [Fimbriiglobus sp.]|jgi:holo-[acyl-carrier protein] synthase